MRLLFITSHPIQYNAPLFAYLTKHSNFTIKVFYTLGENSSSLVDNGFGIRENWNIDLLSGYEYEFIENTSTRPSSLTYKGIKNPSLINRIKAYNPEGIVVYGWKHESHFSVMNYFHGKVPILFRGDSIALDDSLGFSLCSQLRFFFLKWIYRKVDYVISPGTASDQYFLNSGIKEKQIFRAEHAVDNERFMHLSNIEEQLLLDLRYSLSIKSNETVFLFAGKFIEIKNPFLLIDAFVKLKEQNDNNRLLLVGNGLLENNIKSRINSLPQHIASSITILPFQDQNKIKLLYRLADVFVLPSISETWGLSVNEALASGTPVIVSNKCGCSIDLVRNDVNGLSFKSMDCDDLLQKMHLLCNEEYRIRLAANAKVSLSRYTFHSFMIALNQIFAKSEN